MATAPTLNHTSLKSEGRPATNPSCASTNPVTIANASSSAQICMSSDRISVITERNSEKGSLWARTNPIRINSLTRIPRDTLRRQYNRQTQMARLDPVLDRLAKTHRFESDGTIQMPMRAVGYASICAREMGCPSRPVQWTQSIASGYPASVQRAPSIILHPRRHKNEATKVEKSQTKRKGLMHPAQ